MFVSLLLALVVHLAASASSSHLQSSTSGTSRLSEKTAIMLGPLSETLEALSVGQPACNAGAAASASTAFKTTEIGGRLYYRHSLLPVDECYSEDGRNSESKRAMLKEALGSLLPIYLIAIVAGYGASRSLQFAEEMYAELWNGKMDLLGKLYDAERNILIEPHAFWDYLSRGTQPMVGFLHMLLEAEEKHLALKWTLRNFAVLVSDKVPQAAYLIGEYLGDRMSLFWMTDKLGLVATSTTRRPKLFQRTCPCSFGLLTRVYYLLKQSNVERLANYLYSLPLYMFDWFYVLRTLRAVEPALLRKFFAIGFAKDPSRDRELFEMTAPVAMGIEPSLGSDLIAIARRNGWAEPVAEESVQKDFPDSEEAGGSVHVQPLVPVNQSLEKDYNGLHFFGSSTLKTVASKFPLWKLHIAAGNVLCALSHPSEPFYFCIRSFEDGKRNKYELRNGDSVEVHVQHGDVIFMDWRGHFESFIKEEFYSTGLSEKVRFEYIKSFYYAAARNCRVDFVAIVQNDGHGEPEGSEVKVEEMNGRGKGERKVENVEEEELQES